MKSLFKTIILAATPLFFFASCSESDETLDTVKPVIELKTPKDHQEYEFGGKIELIANLSDNVELGSYKIDIHSDSDGHQHKIATTAWDFKDKGTLTGKKFDLIKTIPIPTGDFTEGHYHLGILVTDKAGNETQSFIEIVIGEDHHH